MKTISEIYQDGNLLLTLESISNKQGTVLGYVIFKYNEEGKRYISQATTLENAEKELAFLTNAYKK